MTTTAEAPFQVLEVALDAITPNPDNPRAKLRPDDIADLVASIERNGLFHPVTVAAADARGKHALLAGHRRLAAYKQLKRATIPVHVATGGEQQALEVLLAENHQRQDLDPIRESDLVAELLERFTADEAASVLGRSASWVVRRANLRSLSKGVRAAREPGKALAEWPTIWLEEIALLSHEAQDRIVATQDNSHAKIVDARVLRRLVRAELRTLENVPWKLDDANVAPGCVACTACPRHSQADPGLFGEETGPKELKKATCLDASCFAKKLKAHVDAAAAAARAKHGDTLVFVAGAEIRSRRRTDNDEPYAIEAGVEDVQQAMSDQEREANARAPKKDKARVLEHYQVVEVKKGDKNAVPALVVSGAGAGKVQWIRKPGANDAERTEYSQPRGTSVGPKTMAQKRAQLEARRLLDVIGAVRSYVEDLDGDPRHVKNDEHLLDLVAAYGVEVHTWGYDPIPVSAIGKDLDAKARRKRIFAGVGACMVKALGGDKAWQLKGNETKFAAVAKLICEQLGISYAERVSAAEINNPEPKSWAAEKVEAAEKAAKKSKAKKSAKGAPPAKPTSKPKRDTKKAAAGDRDED